MIIFIYDQLYIHGSIADAKLMYQFCQRTLYVFFIRPIQTERIAFSDRHKGIYLAVPVAVKQSP